MLCTFFFSKEKYFCDPVIYMSITPKTLSSRFPKVKLASKGKRSLSKGICVHKESLIQILAQAVDRQQRLLVLEGRDCTIVPWDLDDLFLYLKDFRKHLQTPESMNQH